MQFGLTKRFAIFGGFIVVLVCTAIATVAHRGVRNDLQVLAESNNVALTRAFSNLVWPRYADFVSSARQLDTETLRTHETTRALRAEVLAAMKGLSVLKVKIYDMAGLTVFSTDPSQIGDDKSENAGFLSARAARVASELTHRDSFSAFEQTIENRDVLSSYIPIQDWSGEIRGVFEIYYDVTALLAKTERSQNLQLAIVTGAMAIMYLALVFFVWHGEKRRQKLHEEKLRLARAAAVAEESSKLKSDFMAHMSHELRTPLNAILGFSEVVKTQLFGPVGSPQYLDYARDIWASGRQLLSIVDDVLDMAKVESGQMFLEKSEFDVAGALKAAARLFEAQARQGNVELCLALPQTPLRLCADERRLKQILLNLLSNAVKFTPAAGKVTLAAERLPDGGIRVIVADTGIGIQREDIPRILAPFGRIAGPYTGDEGGTGLGLPIAKALATLHGAAFEIDSEPGKGTRIAITFPHQPLADGSVAAGSGEKQGKGAAASA